MRNLFHTTLITIGVVLLLASGFFLYQKSGFSQSAGPQFTENSYQAVFLSNGQVYFGKIKETNQQFTTLSDTYYLVRGEPIQAQEPTEEGEAQQQIAFGLRKLGESETHAPIDEMRINRDHVLFIEELKGEGPVVQAIKSHKASPTKPAETE